MKSYITDFYYKYSKSILFILIFILISLFCNLDIQSLNNFLKRGLVLEYSLKENTKINEADLKNKIAENGIKYYLIKSEENPNSQTYDFEDKKIKNILQIGLPILPTEKQKTKINNISDYIFNTYTSSKLISVKTLGSNYHKPFASFLEFLEVLFTSLFIWISILYLCSKDKEFFTKNKDAIICYTKEKANAFVVFCQDTQKKGIKYFLRKVFLDEPQKEEEQDVGKEIINTIVFVLISVIIIRFFIGELRWIPSGSMRLTILEKDRVFVEKVDFPKKEIKRGDVLVFYPPETILKNDPLSIFARLTGILCKDIAYIKRVIGMPNDKLEIKYNPLNEQYRVYINDIALNEPYVMTKNNWTPCSEKVDCGPMIVPENHYFMMGDNRGNSQDSRFWGFLAKDRIIGRANFMFWPISRINKMNDKYLELHKEKNGQNYTTYSYIVNRYELLYKI